MRLGAIRSSYSKTVYLYELPGGPSSIAQLPLRSLEASVGLLTTEKPVYQHIAMQYLEGQLPPI